jgi:hypothetical protein
MVRFRPAQALLFVTLAAAAGAAVSPSGAVAPGEGEEPRTRVGPNVHVSRARAELPHNEVILAADPSDPRHLLAGSKVSYKPGWAAGTQSVAYWSADGGRTWRVTLERKDVPRASDPAVAFGADGSAYFAALPLKGIDLLRSRDHGESWQRVACAGPGVSADRPFLALDQTGGKYRGRLYCNCEFTPPLLDETAARWPTPKADGYAVYSSDDGGKTIHDPPAWRLANPPFKEFGAGNPLVLSDGTLIAPYTVGDMSVPENVGNQPRRLTLCVLRSADGGRSFEGGARVSDWRRTNEDGFPSYAAAPKGAPGQDRVYAAWSDVRGGRHQVLFSYSADKGLTWSKRAVISDEAAREKGPDSFLPAVAVNEDGVVGVSCYDTRDLAADQVGWDARFRASADGGKTWLPSVRVSRESSTFKNARGELGDTGGLAADAEGAFHLLWVDNRTGVQQVWTARVTVR